MSVKESDLAKSVIAWLEEQHWDVYQEVEFKYSSGIADIVAVRDGILWIIETKASLTFTVLEQARHWQAHFRSAAVPQVKTTRGRWTVGQFAKNYLKVGILEVEPINGRVSEFISAPLMREFHERSKIYIGQLRDEHKHYAAAGTNNGGRFTPYRDTMNEVENYIRINPGCTLGEIMKTLSRHHYSSNQSAKTGVRTALANWEPWCEVRVVDGKAHYYHKGR